MPPASATPTAAPDWLHAAAKTDTPPEPERIPLRSSAPPAREPSAPKVEEKRVEPKQITEPIGPAIVDVARYPSRLMFAETVTLAAVSVAWVMIAMPRLPTGFRGWEVYSAVPGAFGLFQLVRWLFRVYGGGYRLTTRQILRVLPGPIPDPEPIDIASIATVDIEQSYSEWFLFAGRLRLTFERESREDIVLGPVGWPKRRAQLLQKAIEAAREGNVVGGRVAA